MVNKPSQISPNDVLQLWLINIVYHLLVKNKSGEGRRGGRLIEDLLYAKNICSRHFVSPHIRDDRSQQVFFCTKDVMRCALWCHLSSLPYQFSIFEDMGELTALLQVTCFDLLFEGEISVCDVLFHSFIIVSVHFRDTVKQSSIVTWSNGH